MIERYLTKEMESIFTDENRFNAYLKVEIAALRGWQECSLVSKEDVDTIEKNAHVDVNRIKEIEAVTRHDVVAFTRQISETLGPEKRFVHYGLTSTDVVDTALSLLYKQANDILAKDFENLLNAVKDKALEYEFTPCIGRTHGMHAEVTTFGLKWANFFDELKRGIFDFSVKRKYLEVCKLSGAVGNYADISPVVQEVASQYLGLKSVDIATQVISRDRHEHYASSLVILASTLEKIAVEIRNLSRTEIHEVEEGFKKGQKGSSAMPQKRNPISSENITGCVRMLRGYLLPIMEDNALYHERDISHSSVERVALIDMIELMDYTTRRMTSVIENLTVFTDRMEENIHLTHDAVFAPNVLKILISKGLSREESYDMIQPYAMKATLSGVDFKDLLLADEKVMSYLSKDELLAAFTYENNLKNLDYIYKKVGLK